MLLTQDLLAVSPEDRRFTLAHELAHVLRYQANERMRYSRTAGVALLLLAVLWLAGGVLFIASAESWVQWTHLDVVLPFAMLAVALSATALLTRPIRMEEAATDELAAVLFGAVVTPHGVERIRRSEGPLRLLPNVLLTHPHPADRRASGLAALARTK